MQEALRLLGELALVRPSTDDPRQLHAVSPGVGMEILLARQRIAQQVRIESSWLAAAEFVAELSDRPPGSTEGGVLRLHGQDQIRDHLSGLGAKAKEEILTFALAWPQAAAEMQTLRPLTQQLLERGIRLRTVYPDSVRRSTPSIDQARSLASLGGEVRTTPTLPTRLIICDRRTALVASDNDPTAEALAVSDRGILSALGALFDNIWSSAAPLGCCQQHEGQESLGPLQMDVLRLLTEGCTDEAVARRLGISTRTARRVAADLMTRLDAKSRLQAGVNAVRRGYL
ncbi:LuxR C-terminal-related transcriptional regulator [Streptacidiphilus sp. N1-3]|uniref:LuxR C-terminal-related transcriptional regulator n=1 Tax=Streptacidiphilus alkalitolerans TaxID=3342712 RepID=A0ABV6X947_9ACTN